VEIFFWKDVAVCTEHHRLFPHQSSAVKIRLPLLFPEIDLGTVCQCQNTDCQIRNNQLCSGRALVIELSPNIITPETHSAFRPRIGSPVTT
jgi:hypothetical protein